MKKKHVFYCNPDEKGKFNWEKFKDLMRLPFIIYKWGRTKATFEKYVPKKSLKQLGYYFGGILPYLEKEQWETTQMNRDQWHEALKEAFGERSYSKCGRFKFTKSVADYEEPEMSFYIEKIKEFSVERLEDQIPAPTHIGDYI